MSVEGVSEREREKEREREREREKEREEEGKKDREGGQTKSIYIEQSKKERMALCMSKC